MLPVLPSSSIGLIKKAGVPCWQDVKLVVGCWLLGNQNPAREMFHVKHFSRGVLIYRLDRVLKVFRVLRFAECAATG